MTGVFYLDEEKGFGLLLTVLLVFAIAGCSSSEGKSVKLAYVAWDSEIASTYVVKRFWSQAGCEGGNASG